MRWLITGGCGFIGTNLIKQLRLLDHECAIRVVDNLSVGSLDDLARVTGYHEVAVCDIGNNDSFGSSVELIKGDILDSDMALAACSNVDVIVHLAANTGVAQSVEDPMLDCKTNVIGTLNFLEGARLHSVKRFVFASSGAPAGEVDPPIHENIVPKPVSPYGSSKLAGEGYCSSYYRCYGIGTVALRFGNVYGPGSAHKSSVVAKFINRTLVGQPIEIYGDGSQTRDFIYIDDLVKAIVCGASNQLVGGEVFQIATNKETTVGELAGLLKSVMEKRGLRTPEIVNSPNRQGDVMRNYSDTSKAKDKLGWVAETSLPVGLDKTVSHFLN